ncbi:MAG: Cys-Gln thioester bond-forming surface protein, partial [Clostridium paraputrificum]
MNKLKRFFRKSKKRIVSTVMLSMMVIGLIPVEAMALVINQEGGFIHDFYFRDISKNMNMKTKIKKDEYGNYVYCMDAMLSAPNGDDLTDGELLDDGAYRILKNGYPNKSITGDRRKDYVITQAAFWAYVDSANFKFENMIGYSYGKRDTEMERLAKELYNTGINGTDSQTINVNFTQTDLEAVFDGSNYVTPYFQVKVTGVLEQAKFRMEMKTQVNGVRYQLRDGRFVDEVPMNTDFRVVVPKGAKEGNVSLRAQGQVKGVRVVVYKSPRNDIQDVAKYEPYYVNDESKDLANVKWNTKGNLEITKTNDFGELVDGAKFGLKDINDCSIVAEAITVGGKLKFESVESGFYDLVELESAPGHVNDFKPQRVEVLP